MKQDFEYIQFDPYMDDCEIECRKVSIVTTRKDHDCFCPSQCQYHPTAKGSRMRYETALVDGTWGRYYTCLSCIDWILDEDDRDDEAFVFCPCGAKNPVNGQK